MGKGWGVWMGKWGRDGVGGWVDGEGVEWVDG